MMGTQLTSAPLPRSYTPLLSSSTSSSSAPRVPDATRRPSVLLSEVSAETESISWPGRCDSDADSIFSDSFASSTAPSDDESDDEFYAFHLPIRRWSSRRSRRPSALSALSAPTAAENSARALSVKTSASEPATSGDRQGTTTPKAGSPEEPESSISTSTASSDGVTPTAPTMASALQAPLPRFTKRAPPLADRVAVLVASPLAGGVPGGPPAPRRPPAPSASSRVAARVAAALESLAADTAAASAACRLHPSQGLTPATANPREAMIPLVVRSLAEHRRDARVAAPGLATLSQLAAAPAFRSKIAESGGLDAIVAVMRLHSLRPGLQADACMLLAALTHHTPANKLSALEAGALTAVVGSMTIHASDERVQTWGCLALRNLTKVSPGDVKHPHAAAVAVEVVANALEHFPTSRTVQMQACVALTNIAALSDVAKVRVGAVGAVRGVVAAVHRNIASAAATDAALSCVAVLATDIDNQRVAVQNGVVHALSRALATHAGNPAVVARAAACIRFLSFTLAHRTLLGAGDIVPHLVAGLRRHGHGPERPLRELMHALGNTVAECPPNKLAAFRAGAVSAGVRILSYHTAREGGLAVVEDACRLLYALLVDCPDAHAGAAESGLLSACLDALREHATGSARVAEHGTAVFVVLARNAGLLHDIRRGSADLASIVRRARAAHTGNRAVARQARDLCDALGLLEQEVQLAWPSGLGDPWAEAGRTRSGFRDRCL